jgi:MOSC domain-containing protein
VESKAPSPRLARIQIHPIKSLDPIEVKEARVGPGGGLEMDRAWALYSVDGQWVNAKRTAAIHLIRAVYAPDLSSVTLSVPGDSRHTPTKTFALPQDTAPAADWFSAYFERPILVRYSPEGFPDDSIANGPTIISTATLDAVSGWFPGLTVDDVRLRFRTTLEISGAPAFWEDQLFGEEERSAIRFRIGEVAFEGSNPCARCPVPARDPLTGEDLVGFQKRFSELRRAQLPTWSPAARFDHFYRLATNTRVASTEHGKLLRLGDPLALD